MEIIKQVISIIYFFTYLKVQDSLLYNCLKDFILPIIIAISGAYFAYYYFVKQNRIDKEKDETKKNEERINKLFYFTIIVEYALENSLEQLNNLKNLIEQTSKSPIELVLMVQSPMHNLKIITDVLNLEEYLIAYTNYYPENRKASVIQFKNIFNSFTMLDGMFKQIPLELQEKYNIEIDGKKRIADIVPKVIDLLSIVLEEFRTNEIESFNELMKQIHPYMSPNISQLASPDLIGLNNTLMLPISNFCDNYNFVKQNKMSDNHVELGLLTSECVSIYNTIIDKTKELIILLKAHEKEIFETIGLITINSEILRKDFGLNENISTNA